MNILPKKRWHVRTKDNIARVRRDEAEAREKERIQHQKLELAESEARINFLRRQSGLPENQLGKDQGSTNVASDTLTNSNEGHQHVDIFADYKSHIKTTSKELEKEKKEEREKYEKQIGYLTYLGQDTNEALKLRSWYEVAPKRAVVGDTVMEKDLKNKHINDPLTLINTLLPSDKLTKSTSPQKRKRSPTVAIESSTPLPEKILKRAETSEDFSKKKKHKKEKKHSNKKSRHREKRNKKYKKTSKEKRNSSALKEAEQQQQKKDMLEKLRKERLSREATERARQEALLAPKQKVETQSGRKETTPRFVQKYNNQYNPELARQNML